ncbi:MAG: helix-turn-helix domain-containing protein [Rubrobacter sp.]|nr:helix-turn-helix domain-containing protein [Rubrobacter sp.]
MSSNDNVITIAVQPEEVNYLTPKQLQQELQIGETLCYKPLKEGRISSVKVGHLIRIPRHQFEEALLEDPEKEMGGNPTKASHPHNRPPDTTGGASDARSIYP